MIGEMARMQNTRCTAQSWMAIESSVNMHRRDERRPIKGVPSTILTPGGVIVAVAGTTVAGTIVAGMAVAEMTVAGTGMAVADHLVAPAAAALVESKADAPALVAPRENAAAAPQGGNAAAAHKREGAAARKERAAAAVH